MNRDLTNGGLTIETNSGGSVAYDLFTINSFTNDTVAPQVFYSRSRGTRAVPTPVVSGDTILNTLFLGRTTNGIEGSGAGLAVSAAIGATVTGAVSTGIAPGSLIFATTDTAGNIAAKLTIGPNGKQTIVAPELTAGAGSGQVDTATISKWMTVNFNGTDYAIPMYLIRS